MESFVPTLPRSVLTAQPGELTISCSTIGRGGRTMAAASDLVSRAFLHPIKMFVRVSGRVRSLAAQCVGRVCGSDCMSLSVTLTSACPIGWTPQDSFCVSGRPRTHGGAATVPVPFHGVPNGPKLPWGRSERGRTSVQRALIKLWPAFFSPSSFKCIRESNVISGFALRSKVGRCSRPPEALSWLAATKKGLPHSTSRPKSRNLFATFFSSKFICSTGKKLPTKKKPSSIREHFPFKRNGP